MTQIGPIGADAELSMRRCRGRKKVVVTLSSLGEAHAGHLAAACGISPTRLKWMMYGHPPQYNAELALVPLGLAEHVWTPLGRVYRITPRGRRKARSITKSWQLRKKRLDPI